MGEIGIFQSFSREVRLVAIIRISMRGIAFLAAHNNTDTDPRLPSRAHGKLTNLPLSIQWAASLPAQDTCFRGFTHQLSLSRRGVMLLAGWRVEGLSGFSCALDGSRVSVSVLLWAAKNAIPLIDVPTFWKLVHFNMNLWAKHPVRWHIYRDGYRTNVLYMRNYGPCLRARQPFTPRWWNNSHFQRILISEWQDVTRTSLTKSERDVMPTQHIDRSALIGCLGIIRKTGQKRLKIQWDAPENGVFEERVLTVIVQSKLHVWGRWLMKQSFGGLRSIWMQFSRTLIVSNDDCPDADLGTNVLSARSASDVMITLPVGNKIVSQDDFLPELEELTAGQGHDKALGSLCWPTSTYLAEKMRLRQLSIFWLFWCQETKGACGPGFKGLIILATDINRLSALLCACMLGSQLACVLPPI